MFREADLSKSMCNLKESLIEKDGNADLTTYGIRVCIDNTTKIKKYSKQKVSKRKIDLYEEDAE